MTAPAVPTVKLFLDGKPVESTSSEWREAVGKLESSREVLNVLLGDVTAKGGPLELLKQISTWDENLPLLLIGEPVPADWAEDLRRRVLASVEMPPSYNKLLDSLHRAQVYREMYDQARERGRQREPNLFRSLVGTSRAIHQVRQMMQQVADTDASVLILGESGTGKEVVARYIHRHSIRSEGAFVAVNCAAIPETMLEAMLFVQGNACRIAGINAADHGVYLVLPCRGDERMQQGMAKPLAAMILMDIHRMFYRVFVGWPGPKCTVAAKAQQLSRAILNAYHRKPARLLGLEPVHHVCRCPWLVIV